ncbi:hypothetical protein FHS26_005297, partial [Rhizobium pisi]|nr:hypothetical protein [Rhizobium pisi]
FGKSALLHQNLLEHLAEKILLLKPLIRGEDYHTTSHASLLIADPLGFMLENCFGGVTPA